MTSAGHSFGVADESRDALIAAARRLVETARARGDRAPSARWVSSKGKPRHTMGQAGPTSRETCQAIGLSRSAAGEINDGESHRLRRRMYQIFADA